MNPYEDLSPKAFWRTAVADKSMFDVSDLWDPKFNIRKVHKIVTFGSCFAQHIGKALEQRGFDWLCSEVPPPNLSEESCKLFNYNVFSARTGNIYTTTLLQQWTEWALGVKDVPDEVWEKNGRYYDPFRPRVEPNGFESPEEVNQSLRQTIKCLRGSIEQANFFVFTLGLTESWFNSESGLEYPMCPGTVAGEFDATKHMFISQDYKTIISALVTSMSLMRSVNPRLKFILTVSPVPLTATNSGRHVVLATMASKSILRAVADQLTTKKGYVDYFPSYEIINSPVFGGAFFEPNKRNVNPFGVSFVMNSFFECLVSKFGGTSNKNLIQKKETNSGDEVCEEELLEVFGK